MSGGIIAIKGFDYQATVILDRLFEHFDAKGGSARARPEGLDDLDLTWTTPAGKHECRYEQIKKPREDHAGNRKPEAWTLQQVIDDLLPNTIKHLTGNTAQQVWVLGDEVAADVGALIAAGEDAPTDALAAYWTVVHRLARNEALRSTGLDTKDRTNLMRWQIPKDYWNDPATAGTKITTDFSQRVTSVASAASARLYLHQAQSIYALLPSILSRTSIDCMYGSEETVAQRVRGRLATRFGLKPSIIENTVFRNLRGFISDISKQAGRSFDNEELEYELRCVWPHMLAVKDAPLLPREHIFRPDLTERLTTRWTGKAVEAIGVSASGKTALASETIARSLSVDPQRLPLYIEITAEARLRDALVGVGFHLRRFGFSNQFAIAVDSAGTEQDVLEKLGRSFASAPRDLLLVFDLVEGTCNDAFSRDLARFVASLPSKGCRVLVFGQESALRVMNKLSRDTHSVSQLDVRGFNFEEFVKLVAEKHPTPDRSRLWDVFIKVTAGRSAGLFAGLAKALAGALSLAAMATAASQPSDGMLEYAERQKFSRVSAAARTAAEKLVCFALPFSRSEAEACFPEDNIGLAIREMTDLGLLRANDPETFELHETVRSGLEGILSVAARRAAHTTLANWYHNRGLFTAEVLHLEFAGELDKAKERARKAFMDGKHWAALAPWIVKHKLVSGAELLTLIRSTQVIEGAYIFPDLIDRLGAPEDAKALLALLREQSDRLVKEYQWGSAVLTAILQLAPECLTDLVAFVLQTISDPRAQETALSMVLLSVRRNGVPLSRGVIAFFVSAPAEVKRRLLPFMLYESRRENLREAFAFICSSDVSLKAASRTSPFSPSLTIGGREDVVEILDALPDVETHRMLVTKSPLLGPLAPLLWRQRRALQPYCIEIVRSEGAEKKVLRSAIRVLIFLMEPTICAVCELIETKTQDGELRGYASLMPCLVPTLVDQTKYKARLTDSALPIPDRAGALSVLAASGADMGSLYSKIRSLEGSPQQMLLWDFFFLQLSAQNPFPEAIALLRARLSEQGKLNVFTAALHKLGALPIPEAAALLVDSVSHRDPAIRQVSALVLGARRSKASLPALTKQFELESDIVLAIGFATSIIASGPTLTASIQHPQLDTPELALWQCVLATRLREEAFADRIVCIAKDARLNWQLRRAAIFASGRLPFELALKEIVPVVMAERSPLTIDRHQALACHAALSWLLLHEARHMHHYFNQGKASFLDFWAEIVEIFMRGDVWPEGIPSGRDAADWLFDRLTHHQWATNSAAPDLVLNELHVPLLQSAVLRALRQTDRPDLIEAEIPRAPSLWLAIKGLVERGRSRQRDADLQPRLRTLTGSSLFNDQPVLHRVLEEIVRPTTTGPDTAPSQPLTENNATQTPTPRLINYTDAVKILAGDAECPPHNAAAPLALGAITKDQFEHLVRLADPVNDRYKYKETYVPRVSFTAVGHTVAQLRTSNSGASEPTGALIRPAIAAANRFGIDIPWHQELMNGVFAQSYLPRFLASLDAQGDDELFYDALRANPDLLLPEICKAAVPIYHLELDDRIVPLIVNYAVSGTDEFFETLCALASKVLSPAIDPALTALFLRWTQSFDLTSQIPQQTENYALWRGFRLLTEHSRFTLVDDWQPSLANVMRCTLTWYHKQNLARVLERHPSSYIQIETMLFREEDWMHYHVDEIARLDEAADRLFNATCD